MFQHVLEVLVVFEDFREIPLQVSIFVLYLRE
jgi:hypothetical protein